LARLVLGRPHQRRADAAPSRAAANEHLRDVGAVRLVLGQMKDELHRADDGAGRAVLGDEQGAFAALDAGGDAAPERLGASEVQRMREADRRVAVDDVDEQRREPGDLGVAGLREAADNEAGGRCGAGHGWQGCRSTGIVAGASVTCIMQSTGV